VYLFIARPALTSISFQAGLFSAILTAFVVPKIQDLKVDPADQSAYYQNQAAYMLSGISQQLASVNPQIPSNYTPYPTFHATASDRRVNIYWLISLVCSLSAALLATLVQQWARAYMRIFQQSRNPLKAARIRLFLFEGAKRLPSVAEFVPGLIHISLILFLWGLGDIILYIDKTVFIATVVPILVCVCLYLYCVFVPIWNHQSPYWTPFSPYIWRLIQIMRKLYNRIRIRLVNIMQDLPAASILRLIQIMRKFYNRIRIRLVNLVQHLQVACILRLIQIMRDLYNHTRILLVNLVYLQVACILRLIQIMRDLYNRIRIRLVSFVQDLQVASMEAHREQSAMEQTGDCKNRDVRAVQWLVNNINGNNEMQAFVLAISGSFNREWGRDVWKKVVRDDPPTSSVGQPRPGLLSLQKGSTVNRLCRCVRNFFESESEGDFMDSKVQRTRMRGCIETAASLVCCADVKLESFGEVAEVLSKVGDKEQTNKSLSIRSNPLFTVRWTCLSLVAVKQIVNDNRLQELAKFALEGIALFQTNLGSRDTVTRALEAAQKMDDDLKKAWEAVLDLRLALEPWSQNQNKTESEIRSILNQDTCKASIKELEGIAMEAVGLNEIDWRVRLLQETMEEVTHKLTRRLPGVFFYELPPTAPNMTNEASDRRVRLLQETMEEVTHKLTPRLASVFFYELPPTAPNTTSEASDLPSVQTTSSPIPPQLIFPGQQLQSIYILGQRLRDITKRENTEWDEETLKSLKYLREVPIPLRGLNYLMERQLWRLLDLHDGGGLGFTIELFFLALRQLSSASPSPDKSSSSELEKEFYTGTFDVIKSNWKKSKNSTGTQRILLDLLCDLIIQGRGIFSDSRYPRYIVKRLLDLVGEMVEGLGLQRDRHRHIDDLLDELTDESLRNRMNAGLRDEALSTIHRSLNTVSS
jgi:hypothetical protein